MPCWHYFSRAQNMACHDLTTTSSPPPAFRYLLGLGLNFCPTPSFTSSKRDIRDFLSRFELDLRKKIYFAGQSLDNNNFDPKLYIPSDWIPPSDSIPAEIRVRIRHTIRQLKKLFRRKIAPPNLLKNQHFLLKALKSSENLMIVKTDKNLGPAIIEKSRYVDFAFRDHLGDDQTYKELTKTQADDALSTFHDAINDLLENFKDAFSPNDHTFLQRSLVTNDSFAHFYLLMKIHKTPLKTRPIVSVSGSLGHGLGLWIDRQLQPLCRKLPSFLDSSYTFKQALMSLPALPSTARLFSADAISMYTNIDTDHALQMISQFLKHKTRLTKKDSTLLIDATTLVMKNNIFQFDDTYWIQLQGTAMGTPPAPMYATLYFGIHETPLIEKYKDNLLFYKRYIDDVFGIWNEPGDDAIWKAFLIDLNDYGRLRWTATPLCKKARFLGHHCHPPTERHSLYNAIRESAEPLPLSALQFCPSAWRVAWTDRRNGSTDC